MKNPNKISECCDKQNYITEPILLNSAQICYLINGDLDAIPTEEANEVDEYIARVMEANNCERYTLDAYNDSMNCPETSLNSINGLLDDNFLTHIIMWKK